jgi:hypothetical protein
MIADLKIGASQNTLQVNFFNFARDYVKIARMMKQRLTFYVTYEKK